MDRNILHLVPQPPNGVSDYAVCYREAIEAHTKWRLRSFASDPPVSGSSLRDLGTIYRRVKSWKTDETLREVAFIHAEIGYKQHDAFYTLFWLRRLMSSMPYCVTVHDPPLVIAPALKPLSLGIGATPVRHALRVLDYTPVGRGIIRSVLARATHIFALSGRGHDAMQLALKKSQNVHSLPFLNYRSARPTKNARQETGPITILFSGFWSHAKGIETLLQAMERIQALEKTPVQLWLTGGAEPIPASINYADTLLQTIRNSSACSIIDVRGYIASEKMDNTFDTAQIFVLPTLSGAGYSASSVLFRAMAAGLPIVATDTGMAREEIHDGATGLLIQPGDAEALASALLRLIRDPDLRKRLGTGAQDHVFSEHSQESVARLAASYYDTVVV